MIGELEEKQRDKIMTEIEERGSGVHVVGSQKGRALSGAVWAWDKPSRAPLDHALSLQQQSTTSPSLAPLTFGF